MARDGSGGYDLPSGNPVVTGTTISSTTHNNTMSDMATEIANSTDKDGQTVITGTWDFNANKIILDADADTSITADTDDQIDLEIGGSDVVQFTSTGLLLNHGTQNYKITSRGTALSIQGQTTATSSQYDFHSKDGDGTDDVEIDIWAKGTPADVTNRERLVVGYAQSTTDFNIYSEADGTGTLRALNLYTEGNSGQLTLTTAGNVTMSGNLSITGSISKGSGTFKIDHPLPSMTETHHLVHSFIEAPLADLIYRGRATLVNGSAQVNIDSAANMTDGTFELLCGNVQCFTSNDSGFTNVKGSVSGNVLTITSESPCDDEVSWIVIGERKDKHMINANWTDETGRVITEPLKNED